MDSQGGDTRKAADIEVGIVREEEVAEAGRVAKLNFSEPCSIVYRQYIFSFQGLVASLLIYGLASFLLCPCSALLHAVLLAAAFALNSAYISACLRFDPRIQHPDLNQVCRYWNRPNCRFLVARDASQGGRIVGTIAIKRRSANEAVGDLSRLRVIEGHQRRGIARRLNEEVERLAKEEFKCEKIALLTHPDLFPKAPVLYERMGYRLVRKATAGVYYPGLYWRESYYEKDL